jgi:hypothetical protein
VRTSCGIERANICVVIIEGASVRDLQATCTTHEGHAVSGHLEGLSSKTHGEIIGDYTSRHLDCYWCITTTLNSQGSGAGEKCSDEDNIRKQVSSIWWTKRVA